MEKKSLLKNKRYLVRIISFLLAFALFVMLPFSWLLQQRAADHVMDSIDSSNQLFLQQMKQNYLLFKDNMSSLTLSIFYRDDVQTLLYNTRQEFMQMYNALRSIKMDVLSAQTSVYSIDIYNASSGEWYSTLTECAFNEESLMQYLSQTEEISKLAPVLRKVRMSENVDAYTYVFSYFMWDYSAPNSGEGSFMVVNQRASWFVESLTQVSRSTYDTRALLVSQDGEIFDYTGKTLEEEDALLVSECMERLKGENLTGEQGNYTSDLASKEYLVSYLRMEKNGDVVILLQNYDQVFSGLRQMYWEFLLLMAAYLVTGIGVIILLSRGLYKPVDELVSYAAIMDEAGNWECTDTDEFARLQAVLKQSRTNNQLLREEKLIRDDVLRRLMLMQLIHNADEEEWKKYQEILPDTPLSKQKHWRLAVVILTVEYSEDNRFGFQREEEELLLFAIHNIFSEVLEGSMVERIKEHEGESVMIVNLPQTDGQALYPALEKLRSLVRETLDLTITVACSEIGTSIHQLPELYRAARTCQNYRMAFGDGQILSMSLCQGNECNQNVSYSAASEKRLIEHIRTKKLEKAVEDLDVICQEIRQLRYQYMLVNVLELTAKIRSCLGESYSLRMKELGMNYAALYDRILAEPTLEGISGILKAHLSLAMDERSLDSAEAADAKNRQFVDRVVAYVEQNYADSNLSLQSIADYMKLSTRYVSKKYRQCTDISINDYILGFRMKQAADMLINTDMTVDQIAGRIGIENNNYFYHLFKKQYGCTPREFATRAREHK